MKPSQKVIEAGKEEEWKQGEINHETCIYGYLVGGQSHEKRSFGGIRTENIILPACSWHTKNLEQAPDWIKRRASGLIEFESDCFNCPAHKNLD